MPLLDLFWSFLMVFLFVIWIWIIISVLIDVFRNDMPGWLKALWVLGIFLVPLLGVLAYLVVHGSDMRMGYAVPQQRAREDYMDYIHEVAGSSGSTEELEKLARLHTQGVLTDDEFEAQKAKILA
ncbi:MAG: SHOCT domain-containing protein [Acidobacteria bacterium]|nr:SHOCT domain-containing protein [Acidobacteriota bacterium]